MNVPPRFRWRSTLTCASRSSVCATISPSTICSVKFLEPTRTTSPRDPTFASAPAAPAAERALCQQEPAVDGQRERGGGNRSRQDDGGIDHRQPAEDVLPET